MGQMSFGGQSENWLSANMGIRPQNIDLDRTQINLDSVSKSIREALCSLRTTIIHHYIGNNTASFKADGSVVTLLDKLLNKQLEPLLTSLVPGSFYLGEESADAFYNQYDAVFAHEYVWAVDEIDGTQNLSLRIPHFGPSIGLYQKTAEGHVPVLGVTYFPVLDEFYFQDQGKVWRQSLATGESLELEPALSAIDKNSIIMVADNFHEHFEFDRNVGPWVPRTMGCVLTDFAYTFTGRSAGTITDFHIWDFGASLALAQQLGVHMRYYEDCDRGKAGEIKFAFSSEDFVLGLPHKNFCLRDNFIVSNAANFETLRSLIKRK